MSSPSSDHPGSSGLAGTMEPASKPDEAPQPLESRAGRGFALARMASGIEAGTIGGLAMLAMLLSESMWDGHVWWEIPNLFGSTFYGPRAFRAGPGMSTLAGIALHFVITGSLGALFGLAFGGIQQRGRLVLLGMLASVGWYSLANAAFWPTVNPWVLVASPRPTTVLSHVLLGACLGYMGQRPRPAPAAGIPSFYDPVSLSDSAPAHPETEIAPEPPLPAQSPVRTEEDAPAQLAAGEEPIPPGGPPEPPAANSFSALE